MDQSRIRKKQGNFYIPLTAAPFRQSNTHKEIQPASLAAARYIRCFWGSEKPYQKTGTDSPPELIIPDTCADIIYHIDHTDHTVTGGFCGINDASFTYYDEAKPGHLISTFAVRFYAWGAYRFSEDSLAGTLNGYDDVQSRFRSLDQMLRPRLLEILSLRERSHIAEEFFTGRLCQIRQNDTVNHAVKQITAQSGTLTVSELAKECFISSRQLERLFGEYIGVTPKKLCSLVRYQCLWNEILRNPGFHIQDAVHKYRYTDQSHLMREFRRYHTMDIRSARIYACEDVGNIQYTHSRLR